MLVFSHQIAPPGTIRGIGTLGRFRFLLDIQGDTPRSRHFAVYDTPWSRNSAVFHTPLNKHFVVYLHKYLAKIEIVTEYL